MNNNMLSALSMAAKDVTPVQSSHVMSSTKSAKTAPSTTTNKIDPPTGSFSELLTQQISEASTPMQSPTPISDATDTKVADAIEKSPSISNADPISADTGILNEQSSILTAMMQQIPIQLSDVSTKDAPQDSKPLLRTELMSNILKRNPSQPSNDERRLNPMEDVDLMNTGSPSLVAANISTTPFAPRTPINPAYAETNTSIHLQTTENQNSSSMNNAIIPLNSLAGNANSYLSTNLDPTIKSTLGAERWSNEFSQKIVWMCTQQNQIAELHLNPAELGPLNVILKISNDQLTAQFTSPHLAVRDAIESAMPRLRELLADSGIMLNNATVSDQSPRDKNADGYKNQDSRQTPQHEIISNVDVTAGAASMNIQIQQTRRHNGILDTFA